MRKERKRAKFSDKRSMATAKPLNSDPKGGVTLDLKKRNRSDDTGLQVQKCIRRVDVKRNVMKTSTRIEVQCLNPRAMLSGKRQVRGLNPGLRSVFYIRNKVRTSIFVSGKYT